MQACFKIYRIRNCDCWLRPHNYDMIYDKGTKYTIESTFSMWIILYTFPLAWQRTSFSFSLAGQFSFAWHDMTWYGKQCFMSWCVLYKGCHNYLIMWHQQLPEFYFPTNPLSECVFEFFLGSVLFLDLLHCLLEEYLKLLQYLCVLLGQMLVHHVGFMMAAEVKYYEM